MRHKNNERGGALIMVLLLVLVFTILGMGLLTMNISAAKQFNKKEEQVQARHLAEMGVLHYKAKVHKRVKDYSENEFKVVMKDGKVDKAASLKKYYQGLCSATSSVDVVPESSSIGSYKLVKGGADCQSSLEKMVLRVQSTGRVDGTSKIIDAEVTISSGKEYGNGGSDGTDISGSLPQKPPYPENNWGNKPLITYLTDINNSNPAKVLYGIAVNKNPFETSAFVEIVGSVDMPKATYWSFNDHLLIAGDFKTNTGGNEDSTINVKKDFYIGGAFHHLSNHTNSNVGGDFIVMGDVAFGTKSNLSVKGNALFGWGISLVDTHAQIMIQENAYFKKPLGNVKNNANVCIKGEIFLWKNNDWAPYLPTDIGYDGFAKSCLGTSSGEPFNWNVDSGVNAKYR